MIDPYSDKTAGYHLFLLPTGKLFEELGEVIRKLAVANNAPVIEPHVTLLARIPSGDEEKVISNTKVLAGKLSPIKISLGDLDMKDAYFRALFMKVNEAETIKDYHNKANDVFSLADEIEYIPHLSLLYGNFSEQEKEKMIGGINLPSDTNFDIDRLFLYRTEGEVENWYRVGEYEFGH